MPEPPWSAECVCTKAQRSERSEFVFHILQFEDDCVGIAHDHVTQFLNLTMIAFAEMFQIMFTNDRSIIAAGEISDKHIVSKSLEADQLQGVWRFERVLSKLS